MTESTKWTRRDALRTGAITAGVVLGGAATSGIGAARGQGGSGFMSVEDFNKALDDDQTFKFVEMDGWMLEHAAGCSGKQNGPTKEYTGYLIEFDEGIFDPTYVTLGHIYVESNRNVETGVWQDVTTARECPPAATATAPWGDEFSQPVLKLAFKPHKG